MSTLEIREEEFIFTHLDLLEEYRSHFRSITSLFKQLQNVGSKLNCHLFQLILKEPSIRYRPLAPKKLRENLIFPLPIDFLKIQMMNQP
jgi:hypothetical protein